MDREQFRSFLLAEIRKVQNSRLWKFMNARERAMNVAAGKLWAEDDPAVNAVLDKYLDLFNASQRREYEEISADDAMYIRFIGEFLWPAVSAGTETGCPRAGGAGTGSNQA